jgi:N6-adenosine-specific RNA methylase IME4
MSVVWDLATSQGKSLEEVLTSIVLADRLPISLGVLAVLARTPVDSLLHELLGSGCEIKVIGGTEFVVKVPSRCLNFQPKLSSESQVRDAVVDLLKWKPLNDSTKSPPQNVRCPFIFLDSCRDEQCEKVHFKPVIREGVTDVSTGLCSYLDLCKNESCKFLHVELLTQTDLHIGDQQLSGCAWMQADVRNIDFQFFFSAIPVSAVMIDPPWDIHMELSYGTLTDDELRDLNIASIHENGFMFIWATSRTLETARDCLRRWGYVRADEIVWLKTNQIGGTVRSGRTGHWLNHNKEHCLVGLKGDVSWSNVGRYRMDCDVIVAPVRENSRKPDEIYNIVERVVGKVSSGICVELFGRNHNRRRGWLTIGNQLDGTFFPSGFFPLEFS